MKLTRSVFLVFICFVFFFQGSNLRADGGVHFSNLAAQPESGLSGYRRTPSARDDNWDFFQVNLGPFSLADAATMGPFKSRGAPGICLFDYDDDGDLDI